MKSLLLILICTLFSAHSFAQTNSITISGRVVDAQSNTPVVNASITQVGTSHGVKSDVEGDFFIKVSKDKIGNLQVTSIGYRPKLLNKIEVVNGEVEVLTIALDRTSNDMSSVVIKTSSHNSHKETVASLYNIQRLSSAISDGISAEVIRKSPDRNTGDVLKRLSGTTIQDNKFVVIRGLNERYNIALLNNSVLPGTEADKKGFSFDIIPSSVVDNVVIYKSATADLPGDFAGGAIKITTKDFPSHPVSEISFSASINSKTTFRNFYKGYPSGNLDWLGYFDNSRLIPGSYYARRGAAYAALDNNTKMSITKQFPNTYGYYAANQSKPNFNFGYTAGDTKLIGDKKIGYLYSVNYSNGNKVVERSRNEYESYDFHDYSYTTTNYATHNNLSALLNLSYSFGNNKISFKNLYNNEFTNNVALRNGINTVNLNEPFKYKSINSEAAANGLLNSVLEGLHSFSNQWTFDWNTSFGLTYKWQPDQRILTYRTDANRDNYFIKLNNQNSPDPTLVGRVYSFLDEKIYGAAANVSKEFNWKGLPQKIRFGTLNYLRDRNVQVDALGLSTTTTTGIRIDESKNSTYSTLLQPANIDNYGIIYATIPANSTDYQGSALLNAAYVLLDSKLSEKIKFTPGLRAERYQQELTANGKNKLAINNTDLLPSALLTYSLTSKTNLRLSVAQSVNRPEFREMADYRVYDYENNYIIIGKPGLQRSKNTNVDLRLETFPSAGEIFSVSTFYKHFIKPIEQTNLGNDVLSFTNADNAFVYGIEMELRKKLNFIPGPLFNRFTFYLNSAYIKGAVKYAELTINSLMQGQSPYLINSGLTYNTANDKLSFNILYNRIGQRLKFRSVLTSSGATAAGRNIFEKPRDVVDFQISKKFLNNRLEAKLTVSDLLNQPYSWYYKYDPNPKNTNFQEDKDRVLNTYQTGVTSSLSLKYSFK